ncbi:MAG TPA: hypothetical protein VFB12_00955 [Ktedonobacteraceae bacterium]|nr:hypothetical protein [Ktedonobacteraceae bacterium]
MTRWKEIRLTSSTLGLGSRLFIACLMFSFLLALAGARKAHAQEAGRTSFFDRLGPGDLRFSPRMAMATEARCSG